MSCVRGEAQGKRICTLIDKFIEFLSISSIVIIIILIAYQIFTRYILHSGSSAIDETIQYLFIWFIYFSMVLAAKEKAHVAVTVLIDRFSGKVKAILEIAIYLLWLYFNLFISFSGILLIRDMLALGSRTPALGILQGYLYLILPISFIWTSYYVLLDLAKSFSALLRKEVQ